MENKEWIIGVVAGDGRISDRYVRVYNNDERVIQKCREIFCNGFGIDQAKLKIRYLRKDRNGFQRNIETVEITVNSKELSQNFNKFKQQLLKSPTNAFISGLYDAEGSIDLRGTVTFWQRKNNNGKEIVRSVTKWLYGNEIKFTQVKNQSFYIIEILGSYKNYENMQKFLKIVKFSTQSKIKDAELILDVFSKHRIIKKEDILEFMKLKGSVTIRDVIENFHIPKMNAYMTLNKLAKENIISKTKSYPNHYIYPTGILR